MYVEWLQHGSFLCIPEWLVALEVQDPNKILLTAKAKNRNTHYDMCTYINSNTVTYMYIYTTFTPYIKGCRCGITWISAHLAVV